MRGAFIYNVVLVLIFNFEKMNLSVNITTTSCFLFLPMYYTIFPALACLQVVL